jgi:hypothetical protein
MGLLWLVDKYKTVFKTLCRFDEESRTKKMIFYNIGIWKVVRFIEFLKKLKKNFIQNKVASFDGAMTFKRTTSSRTTLGKMILSPMTMSIIVTRKSVH